MELIFFRGPVKMPEKLEKERNKIKKCTDKVHFFKTYAKAWLVFFERFY